MRERELLVKPKPAEEYNFKDIIYTKKDWVATITWNRPHVYNAYSTLALVEVKKALADAACDDGVAVVVLTGAGDKAFCTGGDVEEYEKYYTRTPRDFLKWGKLWNDAYLALIHVGKPTIARINGMAVGGGNEWHVACDLSIAAEHATFKQVGTRVGSVAVTACTIMPLLIGDRRAREVLLLGDSFDAKTALEWGWVNKVVPYEKLDDAVAQMCEKLKNKFTDCTRATLNHLNVWKDIAMQNTYHGLDWLAVHFNSMEAHAGMTSFVEKKQPEYMKIRELAASGGSPEFLWGSHTKECKQCGTKYLPEESGYCLKCGKKFE
ncbi:MAG: enoyl-CoA hydratase/isomerase family protein [Syntrophales bacterium]|nr:enoyl-CoA hydratase/isomerase family protein [Syntrophales bacterium]